MDPQLTFAMARHGGVFSTAHAKAAGYDRHAIAARLRSGAWHAVRYGVHTSGELWAAHEDAGRHHHLEAAAVVLRLGRPDSVLSHASAARLHGLLLPADVGTDVELTDPVQHRTGRGYRVRRASLPPEDVTVVGGLPVTTLARTLADVARDWDVVDTVVAVDDVLADGRLTPAELTATALRHRHWPGAGRLARAFGLSRVGAHSPHETRTRLAFMTAGVPEPLLQAGVFVVHGWWASWTCSGRSRRCSVSATGAPRSTTPGSGAPRRRPCGRRSAGTTSWSTWTWWACG